MLRLPYLSRSVIMIFVSTSFAVTVLLIAKAGSRESPVPKTETILPFIFLGYLVIYRVMRYAQDVLLKGKEKVSCHLFNAALAFTAWMTYLGLLLAHATRWGSLFSELAAAFFALLSAQALHQIYHRLKPTDSGPINIHDREATPEDLALAPFGKTK